MTHFDDNLWKKTEFCPPLIRLDRTGLDARLRDSNNKLVKAVPRGYPFCISVNMRDFDPNTECRFTKYVYRVEIQILNHNFMDNNPVVYVNGDLGLNFKTHDGFLIVPIQLYHLKNYELTQDMRDRNEMFRKLGV